MLNPVLKRGILIAIDGIDGAGKTTQCNLLKEWLDSKGYSSVIVKEPSRDGKYAQEIKKRSKRRIFNGKYTPDYELNLFIEDRKENVERFIQPALNENKIVIMDRYYFSTIAYQSALGIDADYIRKLNEVFAPIPDITIILDVTPKIGISRINGRGDRCDSFEKYEYLRKVRQKFLDMNGYPNLFIIDGDDKKTEKQVLENILYYVEPIIKKKLENNREVVIY